MKNKIAHSYFLLRVLPKEKTPIALLEWRTYVYTRNRINKKSGLLSRITTDTPPHWGLRAKWKWIARHEVTRHGSTSGRVKPLKASSSTAILIALVDLCEAEFGKRTAARHKVVSLQPPKFRRGNSILPPGPNGNSTRQSHWCRMR